MATRRKPSRGSKGNTRRRPIRRAAPRRRAVDRTRKASTSKQTIEIVIQQPQPQLLGGSLPGFLPQQVGAIAATTPKRNRF